MKYWVRIVLSRRKRCNWKIALTVTSLVNTKGQKEISCNKELLECFT